MARKAASPTASPTSPPKSIPDTIFPKVLSPARKRLRSECAPVATVSPQSPEKWSSPKRSSVGGNGKSPRKVCNGAVTFSPKSPRKRLADQFEQKPKWNPRDLGQMKAVKEALHVSSAPETIVCRETEQKKVLEFCKEHVRSNKPGSLYVCGCPGTGKTLSMERVKDSLSAWTKEAGILAPDILAINSTTLSNTSAIFSKILEKFHPSKKKIDSPLQYLQGLYTQGKQKSSGKMMLLIVDEMDYLITRDKAVLHDLFMLTTCPFSRVILIGIANAIDLADRFLPHLESLNCKPQVITFRAYSKDEILKILQQRLKVLCCDVFEPLALEFCARKVAAASGDMRRALGACMSAIEVLEVELKDPFLSGQPDLVTFDHMEIALSKAFKSPILNTIQSLPQHQQIVLCSIVKSSKAKKSYSINEVNSLYLDTCKSTQVPAVGMLEFSNMCQVLSDQGLLKIVQSRLEKTKQVTLAVDKTDIAFALKGIRFFRNYLV